MSLRRHRLLPIAGLLAALAGCKPGPETELKVIVGAVLIDGSGGPPVSNSVVIVAGDRIRAAGPRTDLAIPADSEKIDGTGKFVVPGLIDVWARLDAADGPGIRAGLDRFLRTGVTTVRAVTGSPGPLLEFRDAQRAAGAATARLFVVGPEIRPAEPAAARSRVARLAAERMDAVLLGSGPVAAEDAALDEARQHHLPAWTQAVPATASVHLVDAGVSGFLGVFPDVGDLDTAFLARLRNLRMPFAPGLAAFDSQAARSNIRRLAAAGIPLLAGSGRPPAETVRELELLVAAGMGPGDALLAATRDAAAALGQSAKIGTIGPGRRADLLLLDANPEENISNLRRVSRVMLDGRWADLAGSR